MAELLVKAVDATHADPTKDQRGAYKRGYSVVVMPDGHPWGTEERLPKFAVIKVPLVPVTSAVLQKYLAPILGTGVPRPPVLRRRRWQIRWADLPAGAQTTLQTTGVLTIKATAAYTGAFDYTWAQVKTFFRNLETGLDETEDV